MIGVFDSGVGGFNSLPALRKKLPLLDIAYLADRENAPYGTKSEEEIIALVGRGIDRLLMRGADKILLACCTASTVWDRLTARQMESSVPIISYTERAIIGDERLVLVIATERTVADGAFGRLIKRKNPHIGVIEIPMQSLVLAVERGFREGKIRETVLPEIEKIRRLAAEHQPDALVLGCTHFSTVRGLIKEAIPDVRIINPAELGALAMARELCSSGINLRESGKLIYM